MAQTPPNHRIPLVGPWITEREVRYAADAARNGWYQGWDDYVVRFEQEMRAYLSCEFAMTVTSGTTAIHTALAALGVGSGDEVIVPESTWISSASPAVFLGAKPVFVDVEEDTWCMSPVSLEAAISPKTRAIVVVDIYGGMPNWAAVRSIADASGVPILEDAAEAVGSEYCGRKAGTLGDVGIFSFHATKTVAAGEGGMIVTGNPLIADRCRRLKDHGRAEHSDRMWFEGEIGFNYRMSPVQAALGLAQLERIDELLAKRRQIFAWYSDRLGDLPGVRLNATPPGVINSFWMVNAIFERHGALSPRHLVAALGTRGIDSRRFFHPLSSQPVFSRYVDESYAQRNRVAYQLSESGISLPSCPLLEEAEVDRVCSELVALTG